MKTVENKMNEFVSDIEKRMSALADCVAEDTHSFNQAMAERRESIQAFQSQIDVMASLFEKYDRSLSQVRHGLDRTKYLSRSLENIMGEAV